jgi:hypothetical protein
VRFGSGMKGVDCLLSPQSALTIIRYFRHIGSADVQFGGVKENEVVWYVETRNTYHTLVGREHLGCRRIKQVGVAETLIGICDVTG